LSLTEVGFAASVYTVVYGVIQIPAGLVASRLGAYPVLLLGVILMTVSMLVWAGASNAGTLTVARACGGLGGGTILPASIALLASIYDSRRLARAVSIFASGWGVGILIGMSVYTAGLAVADWRVLAMLSAVLGGAVCVLVVSAGSHGRRPPAGSATRVDQSIGVVATNRGVNLLGLMNLGGVVAQVGVLTWVPLYLAGRFHHSASVGSAVLGLAGLAMCFGPAVGAWIAGRQTIRIALVLSQALPAALLLVLGLTRLGAVPVIAVATVLIFTSAFYMGPGQALLARCAPAGTVAIAAGYYNTLGWLGTLFSTYLFGIVSDRAGSLELGFVMLAVFPIAGGIAAYYAAELAA
jgi:predicted MFS family arabinose efflux permease